MGRVEMDGDGKVEMRGEAKIGGPQLTPGGSWMIPYCLCPTLGLCDLTSFHLRELWGPGGRKQSPMFRQKLVSQLGRWSVDEVHRNNGFDEVKSGLCRARSVSPIRTWWCLEPAQLCSDSNASSEASGHDASSGAGRFDGFQLRASCASRAKREHVAAVRLSMGTKYIPIPVLSVQISLMFSR